MSKEELKKKVTELLTEHDEMIDQADESLFNGEFKQEPSKWDSEENTAFQAALNAESITATNVKHHGGEGQGDDYYSVYSFTSGNETVHVKFQGWYASYHGSEFNEWGFIEPKQVTITIFE